MVFYFSWLSCGLPYQLYQSIFQWYTNNNLTAHTGWVLFLLPRSMQFLWSILAGTINKYIQYTIISVCLG
jgi:hypothetical protein